MTSQALEQKRINKTCYRLVCPASRQRLLIGNLLGSDLDQRTCGKEEVWQREKSDSDEISKPRWTPWGRGKPLHSCPELGTRQFLKRAVCQQLEKKFFSSEAGSGECVKAPKHVYCRKMTILTTSNFACIQVNCVQPQLGDEISVFRSFQVLECDTAVVKGIVFSKMCVRG